MCVCFVCVGFFFIKDIYLYFNTNPLVSRAFIIIAVIQVQGFVGLCLNTYALFQRILKTRGIGTVSK